jgi:HEAT repeat protein
MLMPRAKESWQAAQELAQRLARKDKFLKADEVEPTARRIMALLDRFPAGQDVEEPGPAQQYFLMMALARLGTESAAEPLVRLVRDPNASTRRTALQSLAEMRGTDQGRGSVPAILPLLDDRNPAVRIVACAAVSALANPGDPAAIRALSAKLEAERELQWNAATALARLGDPAGKMVLMNMLDRGFWEKLDLEYAEGGATVRRKFTDVEVANYLKSAIEAASFLRDQELAGLVMRLENDKAVSVRDAARAAYAKMAMKKAEMGRNGFTAEGGCATSVEVS